MELNKALDNYISISLTTNTQRSYFEASNFSLTHDIHRVLLTNTCATIFWQILHDKWIVDQSKLTNVPTSFCRN